MAKAAATLDVLSDGRFELGLGAGGIPDVIANFGGPRRTPGEAVEALEEAIDIIRLLWSGAPSVSFEGQYYTLNDARAARRLPRRRATRRPTRLVDRELVRLRRRRLRHARLLAR
jgi:alkanesulfonate monooxygenase SsuD/methylene tetrahydromethanopterin reductase-like flavin-dependent oxidoreductase (luciferase family)